MTLKDYLKVHGVRLFGRNNFHPDEPYPRESLGYFDYAEGLDAVVGQEVWICDYRPNYSVEKKPIRAIFPMKVRIFDSENSKKTIYYSPIYFKEVKKDGTTKSAEIGPFDNTGYRSYTGVSVGIFESYDECVAYFKIQADAAKKIYDEALAKITKDLSERKKKLDDVLREATP